VARDREALQPPDDVGEPEPDELDLGLLDVTQHLLPQIGSRARGSLDRLHGSPFLDSGHKKTPPRGSARSRLEASSPLATDVIVSRDADASYTTGRTRGAPRWSACSALAEGCQQQRDHVRVEMAAGAATQLVERIL